MANEKFKKALYEAVANEYSEVLKECGDESHEFSFEFKKKMHKLIKGKNQPSYNGWATTCRRVASIACILAMIFAMSYIDTVEVDAFNKDYDSLEDFVFIDQTATSELIYIGHNDVPETIEGVYAMTYDMSDYELVDEYCSEVYNYVVYATGDDTTFFSRSVKKNYRASFDTENVETTYRYINGYKGIYFVDNQNCYNFIWDNGDYLFCISTNLGEYALIDMVKSVQKVE